VVNDIDETMAIDTAEDISRETGQKTITPPADVSDPAEVKAMILEVTDVIGPVRHLVNNAATKRYDDLVDISLADWETVLNVNLTGPLLTGREVARSLRAEDLSGSIVNISSVTAILPQPGAGGYSPSKKALGSQTELLALEWSEAGNQVNAICPRMIWTERSDSVYSDDELREKQSRWF
jgi:NAD(P)-dependent dehydrogenase (short-subunit alcohol dehydrogenase family)